MLVAAACLGVVAGAMLQAATGFGFSLARRAAPVRRDRTRARGRAAARARPRGQSPDARHRAATAAPAAALDGADARVRDPGRAGRASRCCARCPRRRCRSRSRSASAGTLAARRVTSAHVPAWLAGLAAGALTTSTSTNGPPMLLHLIGRGVKPEQVRDTLTVVLHRAGRDRRGRAVRHRRSGAARRHADARARARRARRPPRRAARFRATGGERSLRACLDRGADRCRSGRPHRCAPLDPLGLRRNGAVARGPALSRRRLVPGAGAGEQPHARRGGADLRRSGAGVRRLPEPHPVAAAPRAALPAQARVPAA